MSEVVQKNLLWKITTSLEVQNVDKFAKLAVLEDKTAFQLLSLLIGCYIEKHKVDFTPVFEVELVSKLKKTPLETSRQTLKKWRDLDVLKDEQGNRIWWASDSYVVYNLEAVKDFIRRKMHRN
jgi:hypothetical protein